MKEDWQAFLHHLETTLDMEVGPHVHVYDFEAIRKKCDKTAHELVARICQLTSQAHIGDGSTAAIKFEVQQCFILAITDEEIELICRLLAAPLTATTNELLTIAESYYAVEHGAQQMSSGGNTSVNTVHAHCKHYDKGKQQQHKKSTPNNLCCNCTKQYAPGRANCPACESVCSKCGHIRHWKPKCRGGAPPQKQNGKKQHSRKGKRKTQGKKGCIDFIDVDEHCGQYDEIDIHFININPDLSFSDDPDEIKVDYVAKPRKTETYTIVHLPTSCEGKTDASICVKVDTEADAL